MRIRRLALWYRWIEYAAYGRALERRRFAFLDRIAHARRVLILGEGDGRALARLLTIAPGARFDVVEVSAEMIALARARAGNSERIHFLCEDARKVDWPTAGYDAILTFFFLDCFTSAEAAALIGRLSNALAPGGIWLVSEFAIPERGWQRLHAQIWIYTMYLFFRVTTNLRAKELPPFGALLRGSGMQCVERQQEHAGMMISEVWAKRPR